MEAVFGQYFSLLKVVFEQLDFCLKLVKYLVNANLIQQCFALIKMLILHFLSTLMNS
jgi:hypothetical protein